MGSAHWCPPCRGFTPQLAKWYTDDLKAKGLEVVFVSSDKDQGAFDEYYGEMPWVAVPWSSKDIKSALDKKYKVQGIPTLIVLDGEGNLMTKDGRSAVSGDPKGENMPWKPRTLPEVLANVKLLGKDGAEHKGTDLLGKVFAFYFSAHWCPPCRGFTPQFAKWYSEDLKEKGLEVVFVSSDRDESAFKEYFGEQPWLALDYSDRKAKEELSNMFGVQGIPSVVIIDKDGTTISKDGRGSISADPKGLEFPWYPKPVFNLKGGPGDIQEVPTVIAFCEGCDAEASAKIEAAMTPLATKMLADAKAAGEDEPEVGFAIATEGGGIMPQVRKLMGLPAEPSSTPKLMILDIPDEGGYYEGIEGDISSERVASLVADYKAKSLERKQLQK